jgi:2-phospho-L-lactate transferase/gluconeogenesis factor (CofD/UPF0052 family)
VATQLGETEGYNCEEHIKVINNHVGEAIFDIVVVNNQYEGELSPGIEWVKSDPENETGYLIYRADLADKTQPWRHDSARLAKAIMDLYQERTGPLVE